MAQLCAKTSISVIHRLMCVDYQHFFPAQQLFELWFRFLQRNASPQNYLLRVNYERDFVNSIRLSHLRFEIKCAIIIIVQLFAHLKMFDIFLECVIFQHKDHFHVGFYRCMINEVKHLWHKTFHIFYDRVTLPNLHDACE